MPDFTLYNASGFHHSVPEAARAQFAHALGAPTVTAGIANEARYYPREHIFTACLDVVFNQDKAARLAFGGNGSEGGISSEPRLVFAQLTPTDVCLLDSDDTPRSASYDLNAGGERIGAVYQEARYAHLTLRNLSKATVHMFDALGTYHPVEYAYVVSGSAWLANGEEYFTSLADGAYVLLEQTGILH